MESLKGQLLVASADLHDPNFHRTVVLVTEHAEDGALGVVLNRPAEATVVQAVPGLAPLVTDDSPVYVGGPVDQESLIVLAEFEDPDDAAAIVFDDVGFVPGDADIELTAAALRRARVYAGYAGWAAGQLEAELEAEGWIVEPARPEDVFGADPFALWKRVLSRKGGPYAFLATIPPDPSLN